MAPAFGRGISTLQRRLELCCELKSQSPLLLRSQPPPPFHYDDVVGFLIKMRGLLLYIALALTAAISAMPVAPPGQSPIVDTASVIFRRDPDCSARPCANPEGRYVIYGATCAWHGCGLCSPRGFCLPPPHNHDHYDPDNSGNPYGGTNGAASNGEGSQDSTNTCHNDDVQDDAGSCHAIKYKPNAPSPRRQKASCAGSCSTGSYDGSCGRGCGCNWAGTGVFGGLGLDGRCVALAFFGG